MKFSWVNSQENTKEIAEMLSSNLGIKNNNAENYEWRTNKVEINKRLCDEDVGWCQLQSEVNLEDSVEDLKKQVTEELEYPIVCKPQVGVGNRGVKFIENDEELSSYLEELKPENKNGSLVCQLE